MLPPPRNNDQRRRRHERLDAHGKKGDPPPRRERLTVEAITAAGATVGAVWAGASEYAPPMLKAVGGALVGAIGAMGAVKMWREKKRERQRKENR
jgi:hypothetical protein